MEFADSEASLSEIPLKERLNPEKQKFTFQDFEKSIFSSSCLQLDSGEASKDITAQLDIKNNNSN